jgi:hypothetical protein
MFIVQSCLSADSVYKFDDPTIVYIDCVVVFTMQKCTCKFFLLIQARRLTELHVDQHTAWPGPPINQSTLARYQILYPWNTTTYRTYQ